MIQHHVLQLEAHFQVQVDVYNLLDIKWQALHILIPWIQEMKCCLQDEWLETVSMIEVFLSSKYMWTRSDGIFFFPSCWICCMLLIQSINRIYIFVVGDNNSKYQKQRSIQSVRSCSNTLFEQVLESIK